MVHLILTKSLRTAFVRDLDLPTKAFDSPIFEDRLAILDCYTPCLKSYQDYLHLLDKFHNEDEYFAFRNEIRERAIAHLNSKTEIQEFKAFASGLNNLQRGYPKRAVYKEPYIGKYFVSFDIRKGNFTALHHFAPEIFDGYHTYEEWISQFTDIPFIQKSKHFRQSIFGKSNVGDPLMQKYEAYLMNMIIDDIKILSSDLIRCKNADEVVYEITEEQTKTLLPQFQQIVEYNKSRNINIRCEVFHLQRVLHMGYVKDILYGEQPFVFKDFPSYNLPFMLRVMKNEEYHRSDYYRMQGDEMFEHVEAPDFELPDFLKGRFK